MVTPWEPGLTVGARVRVRFTVVPRAMERPMPPVLGSVVRHVHGRGYVVRHDDVTQGRRDFYCPYGAVEELPE